MDKELNEKIYQGNKRLSIVSITISIILFIPLFFLIGNKYFNLFIFLYFIFLFIGMFFAPKICNKIWKNK